MLLDNVICQHIFCHKLLSALLVGELAVILIMMVIIQIIMTKNDQIAHKYKGFWVRNYQF